VESAQVLKPYTQDVVRVPLSSEFGTKSKARSRICLGIRYLIRRTLHMSRKYPPPPQDQPGLLGIGMR